MKLNSKIRMSVKLFACLLVCVCNAVFVIPVMAKNQVIIQADNAKEDSHLIYRAITVTNTYDSQNARIYGIRLQGLDGKVSVCPVDGNTCGVYHSSCIVGRNLSADQTCYIYLKAKDSEAPLGKTSGMITVDAGLAHKVFNINYSQDLYVAGNFYQSSDKNITDFAKWDGSKWSPVSLDYDGFTFMTDVSSLTIMKGDLYAAGAFSDYDSNKDFALVKWNGSDLSAFGDTNGNLGPFYSIAGYHGALYVGGWFDKIDGVSTHNYTRWDGSKWASQWYADGTGPHAMYGMNEKLYIGGDFSTIQSANGPIVEFDSNGDHWHALGQIDDMASAPTVYALTGLDNKLYAGGNFIRKYSSGDLLKNIAKWDGSKWLGLGSGLNNKVYALIGLNHDLYAGGDFTAAGDVSVSHIAKWDGSEWSSLGGGLDGKVLALTTHAGNLYAGGQFVKADGVSVNYIAKWDGSKWSSLGAGLVSSGNDAVKVLLVAPSLDITEQQQN